jgi:hypothetical protein
MFETICQQIGIDADYDERVRRLDILGRVLEGRLYDVLPYEFHEERSAGGEYVQLRHRRPSVRYPLARIVVDDSVSLLFGDGHFPTIDCPDARTRTVLGDIARDSRLNAVMLEAARIGSVGSVAIWFRVLRGRVFFRVLDSKFLVPEWDPEEPDRLLRVTERYKVAGRLLAQRGYADCDPQGMYWFVRQWDDGAETWFVPLPVGSSTDDPQIDQARSVRHGLGFVPITWIRNLPGPVADEIDGACTFASAIETGIEIDYQLSQAGRGLKYSSDPLLLVREPAAPEGEVVRGGGNALVVGQGGDAKLLEINGTAAQAVIDYVRALREYALEGVHANRASADRIAAAQSGRALELMNQGLIWLADRLRVSYGAGLLELAGMIARASQTVPLRVQGEPIEPIDPGVRLSLKWPRWTTPNAEDRNRDAQTLRTLTDGRLLSRSAALKSIADVYDIEDVPAEEAAITREEQP